MNMFCLLLIELYRIETRWVKTLSIFNTILLIELYRIETPYASDTLEQQELLIELYRIET